MRSNKGFSILEVLMAAGLMMVLALALFQMMATQNKDVKMIEEKLNILQVETMLTRVVNDMKVCTDELKNKRVDLTNVKPDTEVTDTSLQLQSFGEVVEVGATPYALNSTSPSGATVSEIKLSKYKGDPNHTSFKAILFVSFAGTLLPRLPLEVPLMFSVDPADPINNKKITGCGAGVAAGGKGSGQVIGQSVIGKVAGKNTSAAPVFLAIINDDEKADCNVKIDGKTVGYHRVAGKGLASVRGNTTVSTMVPPGKEFSTDCTRGTYSITTVPMDPTTTIEQIGAKQYRPASNNCSESVVDEANQICRVSCTSTSAGEYYIDGTPAGANPPPLPVTSSRDQPCPPPPQPAPYQDNSGA
jgi:hypothetical protein